MGAGKYFGDAVPDSPASGCEQDRAIDERLTRRIAAKRACLWKTWNLQLHAASRIATTPWPPAAQIEISPRPEPFSARSLASVATIRPPVAANGCPTASDEPVTFSRDRSIEPSAFGRPSFSWQ